MYLSESRLRYWIGTLIPVSFVLAQYRAPIGGNFGMVMIVGLLLACALTGKLRFYRPIWFVAFLVSLLITTIIAIIRGMGISQSLNFAIGATIYTAAILILSKYISKEALFKSYMTITTFAVVVLYYQSALSYIAGIQVAPLNLLPVSPEDAYLWEADIRPSSIFTEPQLYCSFVLPMLLLAFVRRHYIRVLLLTISIMLSASTFGIASIFVLASWLAISGKFSIKRLFIASLCLAVFVYGLFSLDVFQVAVDKINRTDISTEIRVAKGIIIYDHMSWPNKLMGIPESVDEYIYRNINDFPFIQVYLNNESERLVGYVTTTFGILINYGVVPFILIAVFLTAAYRRMNDHFGRGLIALIVLHSFAATIMFNFLYFFYYVLLMHFMDKNEFQKLTNLNSKALNG